MDDDPYPANLATTSIVALDTQEMIYTLLAIVILLICSGLISASEVAFFSLRQKNIDAIERSSLKKAIQRLLNHPKKLLATILIANNTVNIAIVIISGKLITDLFSVFPTPVWLQTIIQVVLVTFIILLFGEVIPKVFSTYYPLRIAQTMASPMHYMNIIFSWLSYPLLLFGKLLDKLFKRKYSSLSSEELNTVIDLTNDKNVNEEEKKIWKGVVEFGTISVKETMRPRTDVMAIEFSTAYPEVLAFILNAGYSRIPVYKENFDQISGVLYIKDLLPHLGEKDDFEWQQLIRAPFYVPENKMIDDLLKEFQTKKMHMAIVVDEYGGSSGIVTLEDVIEEIVGEINDEFDDEDIIYSKLDNENYVFEGKTTLINLCRIIDLSYEDIESFAGDADTIAGLILQINGTLPERNQEFTINQIVFKIESVDRRRIKRVKVTLQKKVEPNEN